MNIGTGSRSNRSNAACSAEMSLVFFARAGFAIPAFFPVSILIRVQPLGCGLVGDERDDRLERRRGDAGRTRKLQRRDEQRLDFHRPPPLVVLQHGRLVADRAGGLPTARPRRRAFRVDAVRFRDRPRFRSQGAGNVGQFFIFTYLLHRRAGQCAQRRGAQVLHELAPDRFADVFGRRRIEIRLGQRFAQLADSSGFGIVRAADDEHVVSRHVVDDHAGLAQNVRGVDYATDDLVLTENPIQFSPGVQPGKIRRPRTLLREPEPVPPRNAVLGENHRRILAQERESGIRKDPERVRLQGDENKILQTHFFRRIRSSDAAAYHLFTMNQRYPLVAHRVEMRAARHHRHVVPAGGELGRDVTADRAGAEYADSHSHTLVRIILAMPQQLPVVIAGAGPTGIMCALALARERVPVVVCEAEPSLTHDLRAGTFHPPTQEMMAPYGITERMHEHGLRVRHWQIRSRRGGEVAEFDLGVLSDITPYPYRLHLEQHRLTPIQLDILRREAAAEVHFRHRVTGFEQKADSVVVKTESEGIPGKLEASWLVGADGGRSTIRKLLPVEVEGFTWPEQFLVVSTPYDFARHAFTMHAYVADPVEWAAVFKRPDAGPPGLWRLAFPCDPGLPDDELLDAQNVQNRLQGFLPIKEKYEVRYQGIYRVHQRVAAEWRSARVLLAGDAAHLNNPLGGFGLNSGIHDAVNLAGKLAKVWRGEAPAKTTWLPRHRKMKPFPAT